MSHAQEILNEAIDILEWKKINEEDKKILAELKEFLQKKKLMSAKTTNF